MTHIHALPESPDPWGLPEQVVAQLEACARRLPSVGAARLSELPSHLIAFGMQVEESGQVGAAKLKRSTLADRGVEACMAGVLRGMPMPMRELMAATKEGSKHPPSPELGGLFDDDTQVALQMLPVALTVAGGVIIVVLVLWASHEVIEAILAPARATAAAPPRAAAPPKARKYPNQTCEDAELKALEKEKGRLCESGYAANIDALMADDLERLAKLLIAGEDPNAPFTSRYNFTPLQAAVAALQPVREGEAGGYVDVVVLLLRHGADVNAWNEGHTVTPLLTAAQINHVECARILLAAGADPNVRDYVSETPLRLFTKSGALEIVRLLLNCGADMYRAGGDDGMNPISLAARRLHLDLVRLFLAHGADPNVPDNDGMTVLENISYFPIISEPETPEKWERLHEIRRLLGSA